MRSVAKRRRACAAAAAPRREIPPHVDPALFARVLALNDFLFDDERFVGNDVQYDDPRNSFLNEVLDRRTGIPITLALVYMEVARRAGLDVEGVNFPGHFLLRCRGAQGTRYSRDLIIDAHHGGALLTESMCRELLRRHAGDDADVGCRTCSRTRPSRRSSSRMLLNLKRAYVRMYSFPQARDVTELLLAVDPSAMTELRDRGLLAYHLNDSAGGAARPADLSAAVEGRGARRGRARRARADLGARQDAAPARRVVQLTTPGSAAPLRATCSGILARSAASCSPAAVRRQALDLAA